MQRDFTYVVDLAKSIRLLIDAVPVRPADSSEIAEHDSLSAVAPFRIVNIGNSKKIQLLDFISAIEKATGKEAVRNYMEIQAGDVSATWASSELLKSLTGYSPDTDIEQGMAQFVDWYRSFYNV